MNDKRPALVYGTYTLKELRCEANRGLKLIEDVKFTIPERDGSSVNLGTLIDDWEKPDIETEAVDKESGGHVGISGKGKTELIDTVKYRKLIPGRGYKVKGRLMDKATGKALVIGGKQITAEKSFTAAEASGSVKVRFPLDSSAVAGKEVVAFESLYMDGIEVAAHADIDDENQTVSYPSIETVVSYKGGGPGGEFESSDGMPDTGDKSRLLLNAFLLLGAVEALLLFIKHRYCSKADRW